MRASLQRKTGRSGAQREQSSAGDAPPDGEAGQCRLVLPTLKWGGSKGAQVTASSPSFLTRLDPFV